MSVQLVKNEGGRSAPPGQAEVISALVLAGDLSNLTSEQKVLYYIEFIRGVSERTGKPLYGRYRKVGPIQHGPQWLTASFTEDVNEGFISNYAPQYARNSKFAASETDEDWPASNTTQVPPSPYQEGAPHPATATRGGFQQYSPPSENSADPF